MKKRRKQEDDEEATQAERVSGSCLVTKTSMRPLKAYCSDRKKSVILITES
jgi:hypothetical protein